MTLQEFEDSLLADEPIDGVSTPLQALWTAAKGNWEEAHAIVQDDESRDAAWVHAYLHREEGDRSNAAYWYTRARQPFFEGPLEAEWKHIAQALLG